MDAASRETQVGRRVFFGMLAAGGAGILWGAKVQDWLERTLAPITARDGTGLSSFLPVGRFRIYSVTGDLPHRSAEAYRLTVGGLVEHPMTLTLADLKAMPRTRLVKDFQCVTGWRVHHVEWAGVRLSDVLAAAGVRSGAGAVSFHSFDGTYTESLTMDQARRNDVLVAYELENKRISSAHGGPARLYVAPMYGYKSCKWLENIDVVKAVEGGYWEERGYDQNAWIGSSNGRDDSPV